MKTTMKINGTSYTIETNRVRGEVISTVRDANGNRQYLHNVPESVRKMAVQMWMDYPAKKSRR